MAVRTKSIDDINAQYNRIIAANRASTKPNAKRVRKAAKIATRYENNIRKFWGEPRDEFSYRMRDIMPITRSIYARANG